MALRKEIKDAIIKEFALFEGDRGSCELQVALITRRINEISGHLKKFPKDNHTKTGLMKLLGRKKAFCNYLKNRNVLKYNDLMTKIQNSTNL